MNWLDRMIESLNYIEDNLDKEICYEEAARIVCCSTYQFQRMFSYITDVSLAEYIRRRRLTLAAFELQQSNIKVVDVALKYGYDSPTSFTRAFQLMHGITPKLARNKGVSLKAYSRISFQIEIKGVIEMDYRIEERENFRVVGIKEKISTVDDENLRRIPKLWSESFQNGKFSEILALNDEEKDSCVYGICANYCEDAKKFDYYIAASASKDLPEGMEELIIPPSTWAIFECFGPMPDAIQNVWKRIYSEWLPSSRYEHAGTIELELYPKGDGFDNDYKSEIWIPVVPKK